MKTEREIGLKNITFVGSETMLEKTLKIILNATHTNRNHASNIKNGKR